VHEVYSQAGFDRLDASDRSYHSVFHTSAPELARIATAARPAQLVLYHQLFFGSSESALVDEVRVGYPGVVVSAHDLQVF
jgi:ribonuclease BN (tRNA processing enzyme)